nr:hypothetical protein [Nonomuraea sp. SYSU D8015]
MAVPGGGIGDALDEQLHGRGAELGGGYVGGGERRVQGSPP